MELGPIQEDDVEECIVIAEDCSSEGGDIARSSYSLIYTCHVPKKFIFIKCSATIPVTETEEYFPRLHFLEPSVQNFINLTRFNGFQNYPFWFKRETMAIVPYVEAVPLSRCPLPKAEENLEEDDIYSSSGVSVDTNLSSRDSEDGTNLVLEDDAAAKKLHAKFERNFTHFNTPIHMEIDSKEATFIISNADANKENNERILTIKDLVELKI